jgi:hypothetical protein
MKNEYLENKLEYLKGGLVLIEKELNKLKLKFLKLQITPDNIKKYKQIKADYILVNNTIKYIEKTIEE